MLSFEFDRVIVGKHSQVEQPSALYENQAFIFFGPTTKAKKACVLQNTALLDSVLAQKLELSSLVYVQVFIIYMNDIYDLLDTEGNRVLLKRTSAGFEVQATKRPV